MLKTDGDIRGYSVAETVNAAKARGQNCANMMGSGPAGMARHHV